MTILAHLHRRCTRLLMVLPSRQQSATCTLVTYEEGTHRSKVIVSSLRWRLILYCLRQLFCFVAFLSACGQTRRMWMVRQGSSLTWLSIRIRLQGRKPGESNKLFDLIVLPQDTIRPIRSIRGSKRTCPLAYCPPGRVWCIGLSWHTSSVGVPGYSWYCPPGSIALCEATVL